MEDLLKFAQLNPDGPHPYPDRKKKAAVALDLNYAMVDIEEAAFAILEEL